MEDFTFVPAIMLARYCAVQVPTNLQLAHGMGLALREYATHLQLL